MFCILYGIVVNQIHGTYVMTPLWPLRLWVQYFLSTSQTLIDMSLDPVANNVDVESTAISNTGPPCILCMIARKGSRNEMVGMTRWGIFFFSTLIQNPLIHIIEKYYYLIKLSQKNLTIKHVLLLVDTRWEVSWNEDARLQLSMTSSFTARLLPSMILWEMSFSSPKVEEVHSQMTQSDAHHQESNRNT